MIQAEHRHDGRALARCIHRRWRQLKLSTLKLSTMRETGGHAQSLKLSISVRLKQA